MTPLDGVLADHAFVTAVPFFIPTLAVVTVIGVLIWRDRRGEPEEPRDGGDGQDPA